jgi:hypothetical protein
MPSGITTTSQKETIWGLRRYNGVSYSAVGIARSPGLSSVEGPPGVLYIFHRFGVSSYDHD